jgi:hypothetical protein
MLERFRKLSPRKEVTCTTCCKKVYRSEHVEIEDNPERPKIWVSIRGKGYDNDMIGIPRHLWNEFLETLISTPISSQVSE